MSSAPRPSGGPRPTTPHFDVLLRGRRNIAIDLKHPDGVDTLLELVAVGRRPDRGLPPRRDGAPRDRARRVPAPQPESRVRSDDRLGTVGPVAPTRPATTSTTSRWRAPSPTSAATGRPRCRRSTWSATSAAVACSWPSAWCAPCSRRSAAATARSSTRRWSTGRRRSMSMFWAFKSIGLFDEDRRGTNLLDTGAHFYDVYRCADGTYVSVGSIEPQFYAELLRLTGLDDDPEFARQMDKSTWPHLKERLTEVFATKTRDEWCALMEGTDVCFAPVLTMSEAAQHPTQRRSWRPSSRSPAPASLRRRPGTPALPARSAWHRPIPVSTLQKSCATGASTPPELTRSSPAMQSSLRDLAAAPASKGILNGNTGLLSRSS